MSSSIQRAARQSWLLYVLVVVVIVALGVPVVLDHNRAVDQAKIVQDARDRQACIERWANATADRSAFLQAYLLPRNDAQNAFEVAIAADAPRATVTRLRDAFISTSQQYAAVQKANPLPVPPRLACAAEVQALQTPPPGTPTGRSPTGSPAAPSPAPSTRPTSPSRSSPVPAAARTGGPSSSPTAGPRTAAPQATPGAAATATGTARPRPQRAPTTVAARSSSGGLLGGVVGVTCSLAPLVLLCPR